MPSAHSFLLEVTSPHVLHSQTARKIHVAKFRAAKVHLLITTDIAARGIDIPLIDNVSIGQP